MSKITATPEILGAIGSQNEAAVKAVASQIDTEVKTVSNSANEIHVALPYYSDLNTKASAMSDDDLEGASGGAGAIAENNKAASFSDKMKAVTTFAFDAANHNGDADAFIEGAGNAMNNATASSPTTRRPVGVSSESK